MTTSEQNIVIYQGEDIDITVTLTGVTLAGTETIKATFRDRGRSDAIMYIVDAAITVPSTLTISLGSATTAAMRRTDGGGPLHDWSVWREDEGSRTPYLTGTVTVVDTARP